MVTSVPIKLLKPVLMDPKEAKVKEAYLLVDTGVPYSNLTLINPGKNGLEYNKTFGYYHKFAGTLVYRCVYGQGIVMIQKIGDDGVVKEVAVKGIRAGGEIEIPAGYGHCIYNTGRTMMAMIDNSPAGEKWKESESISKMHGLGYFVIDKKGDIGFEKNHNYSFIPQITNF